MASSKPISQTLLVESTIGPRSMNVVIKLVVEDAGFIVREDIYL
ncbi:MAG: hypothetical protein ACI4XL_09930 [Bacillus sp. (in: firmicutes)]